MNADNRREVSSRKIPIFQKLAQNLVRIGLTPNHISVASSIFAIIAGVALGLTPNVGRESKILLFVVAILGIQLRLVCNLLDGLMAVEGGLKTPSGELFNDVPDRISDIAILIGSGFAARSLCQCMIQLGWVAAILAVLTAYIRTLGASMTGKHDFSGPMAKQHRMFIISMGCVGSIFEAFSFWPAGYSLGLALGIVALGSLFTCINRLIRIYHNLEGK